MILLLKVHIHIKNITKLLKRMKFFDNFQGTLSGNSIDRIKKEGTFKIFNKDGSIEIVKI